MIFKKKRPKIGLALGAGAARGYAHIGVIKALEKNGIQIDFIAGSSVGSLIGGIYAATKDIQLIEDLAFNTPRSAIRSFLFDPCLSNGFCKGTKFHAFIEGHVGKTSFDDLQIPFIATSTDLHSGETVLLKDGNVAEAIQISCAVPMVFKPRVKDNYLLTDGGASMPVPVQVVKDMGADIVIAINLYNEYYDETLVSSIGLTTILLNTYGIMSHHLANEYMKQADIRISPPLKHIGWKFIVSDDQKRNAIELGELFMEKEIPAVKTLIEKRSKTVIVNPFLFAKKLSLSFQKKSQSFTETVPAIPAYNIDTVKYFVQK